MTRVASDRQRRGLVARADRARQLGVGLGARPRLPFSGKDVSTGARIAALVRRVFGSLGG
jgi:hypothetical protein